MKRIILLCLLTGIFTTSIGQSKSFRALESKFSGSQDVTSFEAPGFLARSVLWLAGENDLRRAIRRVKSARLVTIPKTSFKTQKVSVGGFKKVLEEDSFNKLAMVREHGEEVTIYGQGNDNSIPNRYMILIDNPDELVAVEITGMIDLNLLTRPTTNP